MILSRLNIRCDSLTVNSSNGSTSFHNGNRVCINVIDRRMYELSVITCILIW
jgi:hypothetical protein